MKAVWLFHSSLLRTQQRSLCTLAQKCVPCIERRVVTGGLWTAHKTRNLQSPFTVKFSTKDNNVIDTPVSAEEQLANLSNEQKEQLEQLKVEVEIQRAYGNRVPTNITADMWLEMIGSTQAYRRKKLKHWSLLEFYKQKKDAEMPERQERHRQLKARTRELVAMEGLVNTINMFVRGGTMLKHYENNLYYAMINGPTVILDMGFEALMGPIELSLLGGQIKYLYALNKLHPEPVHLHLCNLDSTSAQYKAIGRHISDFETTAISASEASYLDLYPRDKLVYLSPNATEHLKSYNEDDVYIIGGLVDKSKIEHTTWTKAKREGIRSARLPLEKYVSWERGSKCLTLDQMIGILLDLRSTGDWMKAFKHLPTRKMQPRQTASSTVPRKIKKSSRS